MWESLKSWVRWVYNWITVITATAVGALYFLVEFLSSLGSEHLVPFFGADRALKIVSGVAIAKALIAYIASRR